MVKNVYWFSCEVPRYSSPNLLRLEISRQIFSKNIQKSSFMKILKNQISWKHSKIKFHENTKNQIS